MNKPVPIPMPIFIPTGKSLDKPWFIDLAIVGGAVLGGLLFASIVWWFLEGRP